MRIRESDIHFSSSNEQEMRHEVETHGEYSFRNVLRGFSVAPRVESQGEHERVARMLQSLVDAILAALDGKKCRTDFAECRQLSQATQRPQMGREMAWKWESTEIISEHEHTEVEGFGLIRTDDGQSIDFKLNLDMCRTYRHEGKNMDSGKVVLHDPLILNFDGKAAELNGERLSFDLDADGRMERIPGLQKGSGFLVLDRNGNGRADDGKELFGPGTGDGFAELAKLDVDGNGWLDEADPGFADLRIWDGEEGQGLSRLGDHGVGALWLGSISSPFALKDQANQLLGEIRASGIYLSADGRVGSLQQVDLALEPEEPE